LNERKKLNNNLKKEEKLKIINNINKILDKIVTSIFIRNIKDLNFVCENNGKYKKMWMFEILNLKDNWMKIQSTCFWYSWIIFVPHLNKIKIKI